jgi:transcriptional regulator with XRE-family HTH domain
MSSGPWYIFLMPKTETISQRLARIRKEKGLSQKELAALTGISARMIAYYETEVPHTSLTKIKTIADALGVSVGEILGIESRQPRAKDTEFLSSVNTKTLKQFKKLLLLSAQDRFMIYRMADSLLEKGNGKHGATG